MDSRKIIKLLEAEGWRKITQKGSHLQFVHPVRPGRVTVPHPRKDIAISTLKSIER